MLSRELKPPSHKKPSISDAVFIIMLFARKTLVSSEIYLEKHDAKDDRKSCWKQIYACAFFACLLAAFQIQRVIKLHSGSCLLNSSQSFMYLILKIDFLESLLNVFLKKREPFHRSTSFGL